MSDQPITPDQISALMSFSVGTLDGRDAMVVLEYAEKPEDILIGARRQLLLAMTPEKARELAEGLLMAAESAGMGKPPTDAQN
jgi:hypothetical protein